MNVSRNGSNDEFAQELFAEVTYSEDNYDYTVLHRKVITKFGNKKIYFLKACDPTNPSKQLQLEATVENEAKLTETNCLDVITKLWPNITMTGDPVDFQNYVINEILTDVCDTREGYRHDIKFSSKGNVFKMSFEGVEFTKSN